MAHKRLRLHKHALTILHDLLILGVVAAIIAVLCVPPVAEFFAKHQTQPVAQVVAKPTVKEHVLPATQPAGFGVAFGDTLRGLSDQELNNQMADIASMGFTWLRTDFDWWALQPENSRKWDWKQYDRVVDAANAHNIKILAVLTQAPPWARPLTCKENSCAPADPNAYATYAKTVVQRYAPKGVHTWEIWNEPNLAGFWGPRANAATYTRFLKAAYTQIKAVDPQAHVLSGGISSLDDNPNSIEQLKFLQQMYAAGAKPYFDSLGYHSYSHPVLPSTVRNWSGWSKIGDLKTSIRSIMASNDDANKLIWLTEFGAPTNGPGGQATAYGYVEGQQPYHMTEAAQAQMATEAINYVEQSPWMAAMFWYSYKDLSTDTSDSENFFGIRRHNGTPKQVYSAFQQLLKR